MPSMDRMSIISGALFFAADVFAIASLAMPHWVVSSVGGATYIGLLQTCLTLHGRSMECFSTREVRAEWMFTFLCVTAGILCVSGTVLLLIISHWIHNIRKFARWLGFVAMITFCLGAVIFPVGFDMDQIGGEAYQLPSSYQVGISYIFFVLALWITVISELFAAKVCLPHF